MREEGGLGSTTHEHAHARKGKKSLAIPHVPALLAPATRATSSLNFLPKLCSIYGQTKDAHC